ncbi:MAG: protein serine/threonine phosphatase 2C family protein [Parachlamydiaceae bacterium]|nr:protein serine/threonine phosphatase 2C family protein [Parachlamydiaceae bacterium]
MVLLKKNIPSFAQNIIKYNRRSIPPSQIQDNLSQEFQDAQTHLNDCAAASSRWRFARPEKCKELIAVEKIGRIGVVHMQGLRPQMEDYHIATQLTFSIKSLIYSIPLYGIFDGHGGVACARYLAKNLARYLKLHLETALTLTNSIDEEDVAIFNVLKLAFVDLGANYRKFYRGEGGSTANIAIIFKNQLWVANVGDTRAILVASGKVIALSEDAKPGLEKYRKGVETRHSTVIDVDGVPRVGGNLATARAVGHSETHSGVNPRSKIIKYPLNQLTEGKNYLIIACDGLWDVASSIEVAKTVQKISHLSPEEIASFLARKAFEAESSDNLSVLVVAL